MKRAKKLILMLLAALALTGCMKLRVIFDVSKDGSVKSGMTFLAAESLIKMTNGDPDDLYEQVKESYENDETFKGKIVKAKEEIGDEQYYGYTVTGLDSELQAKVEGGKIIFEIPAADLLRSAQESFAMFGEQVNSFTEMENSNISMELVINMPNKASCEYGEVKGKTVTIDVLKLPRNVDTIVVTCKKGSVWPFILIVLALAAGAAYFLLKKKPETVAETATVKEAPVEKTVEERPSEEAKELSKDVQSLFEDVIAKPAGETAEDISEPAVDVTDETTEVTDATPEPAEEAAEIGEETAEEPSDEEKNV